MSDKYLVVKSDFDEGFVTNYEFDSNADLIEFMDDYGVNVKNATNIKRGAYCEYIAEWWTFTIVKCW